MINKNKILIVGAGPMSLAYVKVLQTLKIDFDVLGRGKATADSFLQATNINVINYEQVNYKQYSHAIVAVGMEQLAACTQLLVNNGITNILLEKPGGLTTNQIIELDKSLPISNVVLAYNRRFYESVLQAQKLIEQDGGLLSLHYEFTEWSHQIKDLKKPEGVKDNWFLGNSTHVVNLAYLFGGEPKELAAFCAAPIDWHPTGSIFTGSGITTNNILFSYCANWQAPGRWGLELMTAKHRLILKPLEKLQIQNIGSVAIAPYLISDELDIEYKPGLFLQTKYFLENVAHPNQIMLSQHAKHCYWYGKMMGNNNL
jgi:predicted dehydrogenase